MKERQDMFTKVVRLATRQTRDEQFSCGYCVTAEYSLTSDQQLRESQPCAECSLKAEWCRTDTECKQGKEAI